MARFDEPTADQETETAYKKWLAERPPEVRALAERFDIWTLYRLKTTGQRVTLDAFCEDGTIKVIVSHKYNFVTHDRRVFGIDPDDMEPCDLPGEDDPVGYIFGENTLV